MVYRALFAVLCLSVAGCGLVPKDGPSGLSVESSASASGAIAEDAVRYAIVKVGPQSAQIANSATADVGPGFSGMQGTAARSSDIRFAVGDVLTVTIFEAQAGGLFIPAEAGSRAGNFVQLPPQQVDATGNIDVPYVGPVRVAGRTAREVGSGIASRLSNRAIEPQVVVSLAERRGNELAVLGEVNSPLRFSVDPGGVRVLSAIARAGGPRNLAHETVVTIQRGSRTSKAYMSRIVKDPSHNVALQPGDVVYVSREQKVFMAFGATPSPGSIGGTNNRRFSFDDDRMTLAEAVAKAGGLASERADPRSVFVYRIEHVKTLRQMGVGVSGFSGNYVPTIYSMDWGSPEGLFLANVFNIRDKDVVFVSDHPTVDLVKFLNIARSASGVASDISATGSNIRAIGR
jgi:polysaccharide biosynthesis/export protein